jgi:hypothetical protein
MLYFYAKQHGILQAEAFGGSCDFECKEDN